MTEPGARQLVEHYRAVRQKLRFPNGGHDSSEDEIVTNPAALRRMEEERRRSANAAAIAERERLDRLRTARLAKLYRRGCRDRIAKKQVIPIRFADVLRAVSVFYGISKLDICSARRTANVTLPRQVCFYLARMLTLASLPMIGRMCGGRDHTTVLHSFTKINAAITTDPGLANDIATIRAEIERSKRARE